jgi:hypothetical protein
MSGYKLAGRDVEHNSSQKPAPFVISLRKKQKAGPFSGTSFVQRKTLQTFELGFWEARIDCKEMLALESGIWEKAI